ncbi:hypothetical protein [Nocardioides sp.]|uniref:hypothetical protein n=1 Tax=Nocardioides sp. TaxID=35761 RepID=UPI0035284EBE
MTDRLADLLDAEVAHLVVPVPPSAEVLAQGRRLQRRRRTVAVGGAAAATATAVVIGVLAAGAGPRTAPDHRDPAPLTALEAYRTQGAFSVGSDIHFGASGAFVTHLDEKVKSFYYTSAGVLVRTGKVTYTDDSGPSHYVLVRPDGETSRVSLDLGDRAPGADPSQPYLAFADRVGDGDDSWRVVVYDVSADEEAASIPVQGRFTWGGWVAPPVALSGDHVYLGMDDGRVDVDWRAGTVSAPDPGGAATYPEIAGTHVLTDGVAEPSRRQPAGREHPAVLHRPGTGQVILSLELRHLRLGHDVPTGRCGDRRQLLRKPAGEQVRRSTTWPPASTGGCRPTRPSAGRRTTRCSRWTAVGCRSAPR